MKIKVEVNSIQELQKLQDLACKVDVPVFLHSADDSVKIDAKSFIGLFALDFSQDVFLVTDSEWLAKKLSAKNPA